MTVVLALLLAASSAREEARRALRTTGCQGCHDSAVNMDHGDALLQFDLKDPNWSDGMTNRQLPVLLERMGDDRKKEQVVVRRFVDEELARRKAAGR